jgi:hypothetical protein
MVSKIFKHPFIYYTLRALEVQLKKEKGEKIDRLTGVSIRSKGPFGSEGCGISSRHSGRSVRGR